MKKTTWHFRKTTKMLLICVIFTFAVSFNVLSHAQTKPACNDFSSSTRTIMLCCDKPDQNNQKDCKQDCLDRVYDLRDYLKDTTTKQWYIISGFLSILSLLVAVVSFFTVDARKRNSEFEKKCIDATGEIQLFQSHLSGVYDDINTEKSKITYFAAAETKRITEEIEIIFNQQKKRIIDELDPIVQNLINQKLRNIDIESIKKHSLYEELYDTIASKNIDDMDLQELLLFAKREADDAEKIKLFITAEQKFGESPLILFYRGLSYLMLENRDMAIKDFETLLSKEKDNIVALVCLGIAYEKKGMSEEAGNCYKKALDINSVTANMAIDHYSEIIP